MQIIPKQIKLLAYYAVTYACDSCEKDTGFAHIIPMLFLLFFLNML